MTPAARIAAAIQILDRHLAGEPAEKVLTGWGRRHRFAGAGDRAAIRDHVYDALRCRRSFAWAGGAETGRGLMIGALRTGGLDPADLFTGERHAPAPVGPADPPGAPLDAAPPAVRLDCPDWLMPLLEQALGADLAPVLRAMRARAQVFLRVNAARFSVPEAQALLADDGVATRPHPLSPWALEVFENPRRVQSARAYQDGLVEVQDAASQAVCASLDLAGSVLDYCAGGGGKALALAAAGARVVAHDAFAQRMRDLPGRASRAGARITIAETAELAALGPFDTVLCDAPCSGSGTWRRTPEAKWNFTPERLEELTEIQSGILDRAAGLVAPGGCLAYATCSLLAAENGDRAARFLQTHPDWQMTQTRRLTPLDGGDGFFWAHFRAPGEKAAGI